MGNWGIASWQCKSKIKSDAPPQQPGRRHGSQGPALLPPCTHCLSPALGSSHDYRPGPSENARCFSASEKLVQEECCSLKPQQTMCLNTVTRSPKRAALWDILHLHSTHTSASLCSVMLLQMISNSIKNNSVNKGISSPRQKNQ